MKKNKKNNLLVLYMNQNLKNLATVHKIIYDVITIMSDEKKNDEPFQIGVKTKTEEAQIRIYNILVHVFQEFENLFVVKETEDLKVYVERSFVSKARSESCSDQINDKEEKIDEISIN